LSDQRQEHVLKDNIGKLSDVDAKSLEDAKKEAAELKQEAEKMRAEAEEARKASEDVERQLEEFLNDKAQNNTQNGLHLSPTLKGRKGEISIKRNMLMSP
jgi:peptidoglycan hydrolase CwlO-like protein